MEGEQRFKHIRKKYMLADVGTKNLDSISKQKLNKYFFDKCKCITVTDDSNQRGVMKYVQVKNN